MGVANYGVLLALCCALMLSAARSEEASLQMDLASSVADVLNSRPNLDTPDQADLGSSDDLTSGSNLRAVQQIDPPAPAPGPAPSEFATALLESQAREKEEKARLANNAKIYLKPPSCRPTTVDQLTDYGAFRTECAAKPSANRTNVMVKFSNVELRQVNDAKQQFSLALTLGLEWEDQDLTGDQAQPVDLLWQGQKEFDFGNVINKRTVGDAVMVANKNTVTFSQDYELTIQNSWNFKKYPFDTQKLEMTLVSPSLTQKVEAVHIGTEVSSPLFYESSNLNVQSSAGDYDIVVSDHRVTLALSGAQQGPQGAWGSAQTVRVTLTAERRWWKPAVGSVLPIFLAPFIAYAGFFLSSDQVVPRLTLGSVSLLSLLIMYMPENFDQTGNSIAFSLDTWISWFSFLQALCIGLCLFVLCASSALASQDNEDKAHTLDVSLRFTFPLISGLSVFASYVIIWWKDDVSIPVCGALLVTAFFLVLAAYHIGSKKSNISIVDSKDFPGI